MESYLQMKWYGIECQSVSKTKEMNNSVPNKDWKNVFQIKAWLRLFGDIYICHLEGKGEKKENTVIQ